MRTMQMMMMGALVAACAAGAAFGASVRGAEESAHEKGTPVTVNIPGLGAVEGLETAQIRKFMSLPYAEPPVGAKRWQFADPVQPWSGTKQATADPVGCPQTCTLPPHTCPLTQSEDCLLLNVWTPLTASLNEPGSEAARAQGLRGNGAGTGLPVMLFIHGGNLKQGYSGGALYNGTAIANSSEVIVVTINYRLGALGFAASGNSIEGSYGLDDQRVALRWVQQYISAFGGDPDKVTVFGQSAGALSIASHMTSPLSKGLFRGAIIESDPFTIPCRSPKEMADLTKALSHYAGCDGASDPDACLRGISWEKVLAAQDQAEIDVLADLSHLLEIFFPWTPIVDPSGATARALPAQPLDAFAAGQQAMDVPFMVGTVTQEALVFIYEAFGKPVDMTEYDLILVAIFGLENALKIGGKYPVPSQYHNDTRRAAAHVGTRALFECSTRHAVLGNATTGGSGPARTSNAWVYHYSHVMSFGQAIWGPNYTICYDAVCHAAELPFVWHPDLAPDHVSFLPAENTLSASMIRYWTNFATNLDPNVGRQGDDFPTWHPYNAVGEEAVYFDTPAIQPVSRNFTDECNWWDTEIGYHYS